MPLTSDETDKGGEINVPFSHAHVQRDVAFAVLHCQFTVRPPAGGRHRAVTIGGGWWRRWAPVLRLKTAIFQWIAGPSRNTTLTSSGSFVGVSISARKS